MATIQTHQDLQEAIRDLESRQLAEKDSMQQHFHDSYENIKPVNIIKNTVDDINHSAEIKNAILKAAIGLAIGYITKKLIDRYAGGGKTSSSARSRIGTIAQFLMSAWVAKNGTAMKNIIMHFFKQILHKKLQGRQLQLPAASNL